MLRPAALPLLLLAVAACRRPAAAEGVSDSTFVATMAELRKVQSNPTLDSAQRAAARRATLEKQKVTVTQLEQAAAALASDPERASAVWTEIERRVAFTANSDR